MAGAASQYWRAERQRIRAETAEDLYRARTAHGELPDNLVALREQDAKMNSEVLSAMRELASRMEELEQKRGQNYFPDGHSPHR